MARLSKRVLSEDNSELEQPMCKASRNIFDADEVPQSLGTQMRVGQQNEKLQIPNGSKSEQPQRVTRGQGGQIEQLTKVGEQIRPDLDSKGNKLVMTNSGKNIPKRTQENVMAPALQKVRVTKKKKAPDSKTSTIVPLQKEDPPLGSVPQMPAHLTPVPAHTPFLSHITESPPPPCESQQHTNCGIEREERIRDEEKNKDDNDDPPLPPKGQISKHSKPSPRAHKANVIPDSEEEHDSPQGNPAQSQAD
ncbi:hypothetical protein BDZ94DRAFT_1315225 [Collybia nuda]|uniref:Uncharacterized protein n=1 Tax=Collybia nuda TaxID=64659 RepID=A0A9P5XRR9_9AGAR|nr:hypothetical protein BDZ94DRAFT_1315225 [Collybia nuda]